MTEKLKQELRNKIITENRESDYESIKMKEGGLRYMRFYMDDFIDISDEDFKDKVIKGVIEGYKDQPEDIQLYELVTTEMALQRIF